MGSTELLGANELWHTRVPPKVKLFFWFALHNMLRTADRRKRHGLQDDDGCALYCQEPEMGTRLFSSCVVIKEIWLHALHVLQAVDLHHILVDLGVGMSVEWWLRHRL